MLKGKAVMDKGTEDNNVLDCTWYGLWVSFAPLHVPLGQCEVYFGNRMRGACRFK